MAIAMDSKDPMGTLRHESIHALKELGAFTDQEWKVLTNKAKSEWVQKFIKDTNLYDAYKDRYEKENGNLSGFDEYIYEEAIAEAFRNYKPGNLPAGMIGNIWVRLNKLLEALRNAFQKLGFQTTDDIFTRVEEGKQKPTKEVVSEETKLSIKPKGDYEVVRIAQPRGRTTDQVSY
jgi:DNA modification methylase